MVDIGDLKSLAARRAGSSPAAGTKRTANVLFRPGFWSNRDKALYMSANKSAPHTFTKDGVFYFVRRVPVELRRHYTSNRIAYSLRTRSTPVAAARAIRAASQLDEYWYHLRCQDAELPGKHMLRLGLVARVSGTSVAKASTSTV